MRVSLVDAGLVARPRLYEQNNLVNLLVAMGEGRGDKAASCLLRFSIGAPLQPEAAAAFSRDMNELFSRVCRGYKQNVVVAEVVKGMLQVPYGRCDRSTLTLLLFVLPYSWSSSTK